MMNLNPLKILLVDDEKEFISALAERLKLRGFEVETSPDGEKGLTMIRSQAFDIVVIDLMMPGMNGLEALAEIKRIRPELPVILLTGHGSDKEGMEGKRLGASEYLIKPVDIKELIRTITTITGDKS
jgi:DNA-binding response OmpR family regulator